MIPKSCIIALVLVTAGHANAQTLTQPTIPTSADAALASDIAAGATWTTSTTTLAGAMTVLSTNSNGNGGKGQNCHQGNGQGGGACPASP